ncbi:hypothetical protein HMPREF0971_00476 [Segatella oris F0302]|uniref:Uncharacterized protein n=1 Tax=Segatella oris F0302 TaxID=649760 RepID=D1QNE0_9BACT|nr:hypothetical protein HMPREF0971_00476 [Segatella oris F0302]
MKLHTKNFEKAKQLLFFRLFFSVRWSSEVLKTSKEFNKKSSSVRPFLLRFVA